MKFIKFVWGLGLLVAFSCTTSIEKSYPDADAVYLSLTKTFILNKDGSIVNSVEKKVKLLTYRSFQSLYGETRINYNPDIQKLIVSEAYTVNPENKIIKTPENGFNDLLPAFCEDSKAYSHLREMVVSHTGIERNAVINCSYNITTKADKIPFLMGIEELQTDCPIENLTITVKVPSGKELKYVLINAKMEPALVRGTDFDTYTWKFTDIPQRNREIRSAAVCEDVPTLLFSTQEDRSSATNWVGKNLNSNSSLNDDIKKYIGQSIKDKKSPGEKVLKIQEIVVNEIKTLYVPPQLVGFKGRTPEEVWQSNSGTLIEKSALLTALLQSEGLNAETCLNVPGCCAEEKSPFLLIAEPVVKLTAENGDIMLLAADRLNVGNFDFHNPKGIILPLDSSHKEFMITNPAGRISVDGQLTVSGKGIVKGDLTGQFSNCFNPYFEILRNQGNCPNIVTGFKGSVGKLTAEQSEIVFKGEKNDSLTQRGDFRFIGLKECNLGISSLHLAALPFIRTTQLNLGTPISESYHYSFNLPKGYDLVNPVKIELAKPGIGNVSILLNQTGNIVDVIRKIDIFKPAISTVDYLAFKELLDKWNTQKFRQLILKKG